MLLNVNNETQIWYSDSKGDGIPVVFIHGGPGANCKEYQDTNPKFFPKEKFRLIEFDQRGTGESIPSVKMSAEHLNKFNDLTAEDIVQDMEILRKKLDIDKWIVFGGSWGSTVALKYAETHPEHSLSLIIRGIFLNTPAEMDIFFCHRSWKGRPWAQKEFNWFYELIANEHGDLYKEDAKEIIKWYRSKIQAGNIEAIKRWFLFEDNLYESDTPRRELNEDEEGKARSIAYHEANLFYTHAYESPLNLVENVAPLKNVPVWIIQGKNDLVTPDRYAKDLQKAMIAHGVQVQAKYVDAGHLASSKNINMALEEALKNASDLILKDL